MKHRFFWIVGSLVVAVAAVGSVLYFGQKPAGPSTRPVIAATTSEPADRPRPTPTSQPLGTLHSYGDLLHADLKHYPVTQPWAVGVDLADAAHVVFHEPVFICTRGDLWITSDAGDPLPVVLSRATSESEHITRDAVDYIVWATNRKGDLVPSAICACPAGFQLIGAHGSQSLPTRRDFQWDRAMTWQDGDTCRVVVPTDRGIDIINVGDQVTEQYQPLVSDSATLKSTALPLVLFDNRGLLAWMGADTYSGPSACARYVDGQWTRLDSDDWSHPIIHLIPMLDGSVLQIRPREADQVDLVTVALDATPVDKDEINKLVDQLSDDDVSKRTAAYDRLTQFGPGIFPQLKQMRDNALPEAAWRIDALLKGNLTAKLGGMEIADNRLSVFERLPDGGVVLVAPAGVIVPSQNEEPVLVKPDYLVIRPGRAVQELPQELVRKLSPGVTLSAMRDEWIVTDTHGPARFLYPDQLAPLVHESERQFTRVTAIDARGRWLIKPSPDATTTRASAPPIDAVPTLLLDPTIPDPSPRLAIWCIDSGTKTGWNAANWPMLEKKSDHWIIGRNGWELAPADAKLISDIPAATTQPQSMPLLDSLGKHYLDGKSTLTVNDSKVGISIWPLPDEIASTGDGRAWLVSTSNGLLFLFNDPDRVARLRATPGESQPFDIEAVFSRAMPRLQNIQRVWLDPAGRIDVVYNDSQLAIIFPTGQVPPNISDKILLQDLRIIEP